MPLSVHLNPRVHLDKLGPKQKIFVQHIHVRSYRENLLTPGLRPSKLAIQPDSTFPRKCHSSSWADEVGVRQIRTPSINFASVMAGKVSARNSFAERDVLKRPNFMCKGGKRTLSSGIRGSEVTFFSPGSFCPRGSQTGFRKWLTRSREFRRHKKHPNVM